MSGYVVAIDQGTTGSTVLIFDHGGAVKARAYSEFTQYYPQPGWVEHDANEIWEVTYKVIGEALRIGGIDAAEIVAIGITNQRETVVLWDRDTGQPIARAIVWQDRRTSDYCTQLKAEGREQAFRAKTGLVIDPYFSGTKVRWLLKHHPGLAKRAENGEIAFGTIDSWLVYKLSGGKTHITDYSNASRTLLYNIYDLQWDQEILSLLEIPAAILPEVKPSSFVYGQTHPDSFHGATVPISGIAGDQQAALFGQACFGPGLAKNTYGTGSFVLMNTGQVAPVGKGKLLTTIAWKVGDEPVEYALEGAVFVTGAAVQWLRDGLKMIKSAKETEELARSVPSTGGVYFVPALTGLGAPHWDPYARGALLGITRGTTNAHIARAVLESICFQVRDVVEAMVEETGIEFEELRAGLRADGGASVNSFLMQFQADQLGVAVEVPKIIETTALGAAYLAGLATGFWSSRDELSANWQLAHRYEPSLDEETRQRQYRWWKKAVERAKAWEEPEDSSQEG